MIYIGTHVFEIIETPQKILKFRAMSDEPMGPYGYGGFSPAIHSAYREEVHKDLHWVTKKIFNEGYYMKPKHVEYLESLAKAYEFKPLIAWFERYWEKRDNESICNNLPSEAQNRPNIEHENQKKIREFKHEILLSEDGEAMKKARIRYLEAENVTILSQTKEMERDFQRMEDQDYEQWWIDIAKEMRGYDKLTGKVKSNEISIAHLKGKYEDKKQVVTDEMIKVAKQVPFDKLIKLEQIGGRKRCRCPFHNEKTASFFVYPDTNRGYCHGCGKSVDTIQYMVETQKVDFNEAVRMLLSY